MESHGNISWAGARQLEHGGEEVLKSNIKRGLFCYYELYEALDPISITAFFFVSFCCLLSVFLKLCDQF